MLNVDQAKILQMLEYAKKPLSFNAIAGNFMLIDNETDSISLYTVRNELHRLRCLHCVKQVQVSNGKFVYKLTDVGVSYLKEYKEKLNGGSE